MSEENEAAAGEAPPEGESQKGNGEAKGKPGDNRIPLHRVNEMIAKAVTTARAAFATEMAPLIEAAKASNKVAEVAKPVQTYTKAQLAEFVEAGRLTQDAADALERRQIIDEAKREAVAEAKIVVASGDLQRNVATQMAEFQVLIPDAWQEGTDEREQVRKAYKRVVASGVQGTKEQLELLAMTQAFGDPADIRRARGLGRNGPADSFEDSGGSGGRHNRGEESGADAPPKGMDARQRAHYEKGIAAGRYKDWSEVRAELKFATSKRA